LPGSRLPFGPVRQHRRAAWALAVAGPVLITLVAFPFRSTIGTAGVLFCILLAVVATGVLGGVRPALLAVLLGYLLGIFFFASPYLDLRAAKPGDFVALIAFVVVGGSVGILVDNLRRLAEEQAALRRVATLVARAVSQDELFAVVAEEVGSLLAVDFTAMGRYLPGGKMTFVGGWSRGDEPQLPFGIEWSLGGTNVSSLVAQTGRPARIDNRAKFSGPLAAVPVESMRSDIGAPIMVAGNLWGVMIIGTKKARPLPRDTEARLAGFTDLVATAIANAAAQAELRASRMRIVSAADQTRRRIERDLHDGIQQRVVTLALRLGGAIESVPADLPELAAELRDTERGLQEMLEEVREISRGLHPAILSEAGLGPALKSLARRSAVPVELEVRVDGRLPASIEAAAYYLVSEALANTAKHAKASVAKVMLEKRDGLIHIQVTDDGAGGADPRRGSGLVGLTDRVEALGGKIVISSAPGEGTTMNAALPTA
jgi:signal transduction histidine kinase